MKLQLLYTGLDIPITWHNTVELFLFMLNLQFSFIISKFGEYLVIHRDWGCSSRHTDVISTHFFWGLQSESELQGWKDVAHLRRLAVRTHVCRYSTWRAGILHFERLYPLLCTSFNVRAPVREVQCQLSS